MIEKQMKIDYLDKMVKYVESSLHVTLLVKASKVVSGLEADLTNIFLQHLAIASDKSNINNNNSNNNNK